MVVARILKQAPRPPGKRCGSTRSWHCQTSEHKSVQMQTSCTCKIYTCMTRRATQLYMLDSTLNVYQKCRYAPYLCIIGSSSKNIDIKGCHSSFVVSCPGGVEKRTSRKPQLLRTELHNASEKIRVRRSSGDGGPYQTSTCSFCRVA
jgi:hypothetical protein